MWDLTEGTVLRALMASERLFRISLVWSDDQVSTPEALGNI